MTTTLQMEPGEMREVSRALAHMADTLRDAQRWAADGTAPAAAGYDEVSTGVARAVDETGRAQRAVSATVLRDLTDLAHAVGRHAELVARRDAETAEHLTARA
ncbi:PE domain-containing protein [Tsukamurella soli]|uniref:PE domain-containing protein n=1 Tax=Tsukamurella soli TaxID=644556 RepID=A0ABP8KL85_9ACTN